MREIKLFAAKSMSTKDVRIDTKLNKFIFSKGIRNVPYARCAKWPTLECLSHCLAFLLASYAP